MGEGSARDPHQIRGNPLRIGYREFADIFRDVRSAKGLRTKLGYVFKHPGCSPGPPTEHSGGQAPSVLSSLAS